MSVFALNWWKFQQSSRKVQVKVLNFMKILIAGSKWAQGEYLPWKHFSDFTHFMRILDDFFWCFHDVCRALIPEWLKAKACNLTKKVSTVGAPLPFFRNFYYFIEHLRLIYFTLSIFRFRYIPIQITWKICSSPLFSPSWLSSLYLHFYTLLFQSSRYIFAVFRDIFRSLSNI